MRSPGDASRHQEYSSHNATTLTMGKAPDAKRFNSVTQLRTERMVERGEIETALKPDFATFQESDKKANMTAQISAALLNDRSTTAIDHNTLTNLVITNNDSSVNILPRNSNNSSTPGLSTVQIKQ